MTSQFGQQAQYQAAHPPHLTKHNNQLFEFDSPNTIAKQQHFTQAGGAPPGFSQAPPAPALPQFSRKQSRPLNLRTRDWSNKPWAAQQGWQGDSYSAPAYFLNTNAKVPSSIPASASGLPTSHYTPSSTIPLDHNYHLPSSQLARSSSTSNVPTAALNKDYANNYPSSSLSKSGIPPAPAFTGFRTHQWRQARNRPLRLRTRNWGDRSNKGWSGFNNSSVLNEPFLRNRSRASNVPTAALNKDYANNSNNYPSSSLSKSGIPPAPAFTGFRTHQWRQARNRPLRLRTRNWGYRSNKGWSGFNNSSVLSEPFLRNRSRAAPDAPRMPSFLAARKWRSGPYRIRPLRTRNWGFRTEDGWSQFNRGIYSHESALPFNANRPKFTEAPRSLNTTQISSAPIAPIALPIAAAPIAAGAPLTGRKGRRAAKRLAKQQAIQAKLTSGLTPPVGDPAVNHYRTGAKTTVPITGPTRAGVAPPTGSFRSRRTGRHNNLGRRRNRLAAPTLPVVAAPRPAGFSSAAGIPLASAAPIAAIPLEKKLQQPTVWIRPTGSATF